LSKKNKLFAGVQIIQKYHRSFNMLISVIVPIYNVEAFLCQCINSILEQLTEDMELILVDDGSPDRCPQICDEYAKKDNRIKVIHKTNGGHVSAREAGLKAAKGDYIMFVDSDDWLEKSAINTIIGIIEKYHPDIVAFGFIRESEDERKEYLNSMPAGLYKGIQKEFIYKRMIYDDSRPFYTFGIHPSVCCKVIKREVLSKWQNSVDHSIVIGEDLACTVPCLLDSSSIYIIDKSLYHYRKNKTSITQTYNPYAFQNLKVLLSCLRQNINWTWYDIDNQINAYTTFMLLNILRDICLKHNHRDALKFIRANMDDDLRGMVRKAKIKNLSFKTYIKILAIKHGWWALYYYISIRSNFRYMNQHDKSIITE